MADVETTTWCDCGHSLYDHANRSPEEPAGECFVGGCKCQRFWAEMVERVDLDSLDAAYQDGTLTWDHLNVIPALVDELRFARKVADQARLQFRPHAYLRHALNAYDRHATPSTPDRSEEGSR